MIRHIEHGYIQAFIRLATSVSYGYQLCYIRDGFLTNLAMYVVQQPRLVQLMATQNQICSIQSSA
jgi:hypothetical protein